MRPIVLQFASYPDNSNRKKRTLMETTDQKKADGMPTLSEEWYRMLIENTHDIVYSFNKEGIFEYLSPSWERVMELPVTETIGKSIHEQVHPDDLAASRDYLEKTLLTGLPQEEFEIRLQHNDGKWRYFTTSYVPVRDKSGAIISLFGSAKHITKRKEADERELQIRQNLETFFNADNDFLFVLDLQGNIITTNNKVLDHLNYTLDELVGKSILEIHPPEYKERAVHIMQQIINNQTNQCLLPIMTRSGEYIPVETRLSRGLWNGEPAFFGVTKDLSDIKFSEEKFSKAFQINPSACMISDSNTSQIVDVNEIFCTELGFEKSEVIGKTIYEIGLLDQETIDQIFKDEQESGKIINRLTDIRTNEGAVRHVYISSEMISLQEKNFRYLVARDVTDLMNTQLELKKSERQYRQLFENMSNGFALHQMIYDSEGRPCDYRYLEVNAAFGTQTGLNPQTIIGHTIKELLPDTEKSWINTYGEVAESGKSMSFEKYAAELDRYFDVTVFSPEKGQFATLFTDITERRLREEKIQILLQAVTQSPVSIVITDKSGNIEYVNPKFTDITGYSLEESIGKNPRISQSGKTPRELYEELWRSISSGKPWTGVLLNKKKNGELYWESVSISPIINAEGLIIHYVAVKEDITIRKTMEEELKAAKEKAEESERLKAAFLANMSHEIRTPMNGILGFADLLREPKLSAEEHDQYLSIIETSGQRMLNIINDLINISKVESGQMKLSIGETNINEQLLFLYNFFKLEAKQKGIELLFVYPLKDKDSIIKTDREKVYAVLTNLIKNALKFTSEGSITIGYEVVNDTLQFFVQDTGIGIPESHLSAVFDRFKQVDSELTSGIEGSGLGLSIAKAYIELLGGSIWVESELGKGSTFYFTLPYSKETRKSEEKPIYITRQGIPRKEYPQGITILIAEDDESSQKYLQAVLNNMNFNLIFVRNGYEAVEACQRDPKINVVLMDIKMSVMDGYTAAKMIRQIRPQMPIIAQTAIAVDTEQYADVFNVYLTKPIRASEMISAIDKVLNQ